MSPDISDQILDDLRQAEQEVIDSLGRIIGLFETHISHLEDLEKTS